MDRHFLLGLILTLVGSFIIAVPLAFVYNNIVLTMIVCGIWGFVFSIIWNR